MTTKRKSRESTILHNLNAIYPDIEKMYIDLHEHPELSMQEVRTSAKVASRLKDAGFEVTSGVGGTGVVGLLRNGSGPTVMLRGDMDALPIEEKTGLPYASKVKVKNPNGEVIPVGHMCGHDVHTSCLVGTASLLAQGKQTWAGTLMIVAQPGEETMQGAKAMLDDGLFTRFPKPDVALAQHTMFSPAGTISYHPGYTLAAEHNVRIRLFGVGAHGSMPQKSIDPVVMASALTMRLQTIVSREIAPGEMAVVTVGAINSGTRYNIIPDVAELDLSIRTFKDEVFQHIYSALTRMAHAEAAASNAPTPPEVSIVEASQATYNDAEPTRQVAAALTQYFGADCVKEISAVTASEDFSLYGHAPGGAGVPSCYYFLGVTDPELYAEKKGNVPGPHSPFYTPDRERSLKTGLQALTVAALSQLGSP
ncbi:hippurate hydrolase [Dictyobacter sp. S3.2.2.5]|uniref:Hippurate hydrolase n=1 Tax=Dictyobacter halimunensis TaxID=3026934 RepID=A0ABQ6G1I1_9CHLR|nr:hippurate hydrolase [Dictyobacter sp. S3.2.2.5]